MRELMIQVPALKQRYGNTKKLSACSARLWIPVDLFNHVEARPAL